MANSAPPAQHHHISPVHPNSSTCRWRRIFDAAKKLLADAGYPDGIDVELHAKKDPDWEPTACQAMVQQWADAGIRVKLTVLPSAQFWDVWTKVPFGFTVWTHRPLGIMVLGLAYRTGVPWNESNFKNPKFDELLTKAEGLVDLEQAQGSDQGDRAPDAGRRPDRPAAVAPELSALRQAAEGLRSASDRVLLLRSACGGTSKSQSHWR